MRRQMRGIPQESNEFHGEGMQEWGPWALHSASNLAAGVQARPGACATHYLCSPPICSPWMTPQCGERLRPRVSRTAIFSDTHTSLWPLERAVEQPGPGKRHPHPALRLLRLLRLLAPDQRGPQLSRRAKKGRIGEGREEAVAGPAGPFGLLFKWRCTWASRSQKAWLKDLGGCVCNELFLKTPATQGRASASPHRRPRGAGVPAPGAAVRLLAAQTQAGGRVLGWPH